MSKVLNDTIMLKVIEPEKKENITAGGIVTLSEPAKNSQQVEAEIYDVGPGRLLADGTRVKPEVKIGDKILVSPYVGIEVTIGDEKFKLVKENDILIVF